MPAILSLENVFYAVWIILAAAGLYLTIQIYRRKMEWPRARRMGITMNIFVWINVIYGLVLFEGAYGVASVILDLPLWADIALLLVIFGMTMGVYFKLLGREKFNRTVFTALFLIPLSVPGTHAAAKLIPAAGKLMPAVVKLVPQAIPPVQTTKVLTRTGAPETPRPKTENPRRYPQWPQFIQIGKHIVKFKNPQEKGTLGDSLTVKRMTAKGYEYLSSRVNKVHGLDGVFVRYDNGNLREIVVVENKVDGGTLRPGQMTDEWVAERVDQMILRGGVKARRAGELIREYPDLVRKELHHYDLNSGRTTINTLDAGARKTSKERVEGFINNQVRKRCESANTKLNCLPAT